MTRRQIIIAISEMKDCTMNQAEEILHKYEKCDPEIYNNFLEGIADYWFNL